jgi:deoxyribose-phosphate aldolase
MNEAELKDSVSQVIKYPIHSLSVLPSSVKTIKNIIDTNTITLSCPIDYPMGIMDLKSRITLTEQCIKNGAKIIDAVCPSFILTNRKYDKLREDIKTLQSVTNNSGVILRYFLEYRVYSYDLLYKVSQIMSDLGIKTILPSTGYLLDDIHDNILASVLIAKKVSNIHIICNGNIWLKSHYDMLKKANLYGIRVGSLHSLKLLLDQ